MLIFQSYQLPKKRKRQRKTQKMKLSMMLNPSAPKFWVNLKNQSQLLKKNQTQMNSSLQLVHFQEIKKIAFNKLWLIQ